jgi:hypothetical protein
VITQKKSFCQELKQVFDDFTTYHMKFCLEIVMHIDFQKTFDLVMRQVVCNIRIQFGITMKLFLVIKFVSMNLLYILIRQKFA